MVLAMVGAIIAITQRLPYEFGGTGNPEGVLGNFVHGSGTAMSAPLGALLVFGVFSLLTTRRH